MRVDIPNERQSLHRGGGVVIISPSPSLLALYYVNGHPLSENITFHCHPTHLLFFVYYRSRLQPFPRPLVSLANSFFPTLSRFSEFCTFTVALYTCGPFTLPGFQRRILRKHKSHTVNISILRHWAPF